MTENALVSARGVVFFRKQDNLNDDLQKELIHRLGLAAGKPSTSTLHIHPVLNTEDDVGEKREADKEISTISSKLFQKLYNKESEDTVCKKQQTSNQWHADISFEPVPADYTSLRLTQLPKTGGGKQLKISAQDYIVLLTAS
jgi:alpha-ketoglutarate-dependent taurine dioxygenase